MADHMKVEDFVAEALADLSEHQNADKKALANGDTETEEDMSDTTSSSSDSSSSSEQNSMQEDPLGPFYQVTCGGNDAKFYLNRFARGSIGKCVFFEDDWLTPNEFQAISGRQSSKDWKRSIRYKGRCIKELIYNQKFQEHRRECSCPICLGDRDRVELRDVDSVRSGDFNPMVTVPSTKRRKSSTLDDSSSSLPNTAVVNNYARSHSGRGRKPKVSPSTPLCSRELWSQDSKQDLETASMQDHSPSDVRIRRPRKAKGHMYHTQIGTYSSAPKFWSVQDVGEFLQAQGFSDIMEAFSDHEVDGRSLLLLTEKHLVENFGMKLGPTLKLLDCVARLSHPS